VVYGLHEAANDNMPGAEARSLRARLADLHHPDLHWHEQPVAGHWWDAPRDEPGFACVDWPPMMEFFARRRIPAHDEVPDVDFTTPDPSVTRSCFWLEVRAQARSRVPSRVRLHRSMSKR